MFLKMNVINAENPKEDIAMTIINAKNSKILVFGLANLRYLL